MHIVGFVYVNLFYAYDLLPYSPFLQPTPGPYQANIYHYQPFTIFNIYMTHSTLTFCNPFTFAWGVWRYLAYHNICYMSTLWPFTIFTLSNKVNPLPFMTLFTFCDVKESCIPQHLACGSVSTHCVVTPPTRTPHPLCGPEYIFCTLPTMRGVCIMLYILGVEQGVVPWRKNEDEKQCQRCGRGFGVRRRRHHCRLCGGIFCKQCSQFMSLTETCAFIIITIYK